MHQPICFYGSNASARCASAHMGGSTVRCKTMKIFIGEPFQMYLIREQIVSLWLEKTGYGYCQKIGVYVYH